MPIRDVPLPDTSSLHLGHTADFLLSRAEHRNVNDIIMGLVAAFERDGIVLDRFFMVTATLHPEVAAISCVWTRGGELVVSDRLWSSVTTEAFKTSPIARFRERTHEVIRRKICDPSCPTDFPVVGELRDVGGTDYIAFSLAQEHATIVNAMSCATKAPGGFTDEQIHTILSVRPLLSLVVEAVVERRIAAQLLSTYLGHDAGSRVLAGEVQRGRGQNIPAVITFCDIRNYTMLSDTLSQKDLLTLLDDAFDAVVSGVQAHGGEVLKFIGDAVLAIFRADTGCEKDACRRARDAVADVLRRIDDKNAQRGVDLPAIAVGLSLHFGEVHYGNIGGPARLDFTVIGPAVNLASRLEGLCRPLGQKVIASQTFAEQIGEGTVDLGEVAIKGLAAKQRIFGLALD